jgi:hypothetical protein
MPYILLHSLMQRSHALYRHGGYAKCLCPCMYLPVINNELRDSWEEHLRKNGRS